ncbi:putative sensor histidine kinase pdtaS [Pedobacter sp. Bi27]|uniref:tetratricopeptide repeat-containing sensor histidine kinase n=1 Tax=Pedobacter sp. Bi27 TaxID=2822351 RepID=UPI001DD48382|nr:histidine kinase dimerization/phosphoacceptor domain -containing protein [Pedobacter sp. Bi27]CAH0298240.1 putative sensor histidine kinase pdtaS [Pedobacter sp. Bi27]
MPTINKIANCCWPEFRFLLITFMLISPVLAKGQGIRTIKEVETAEIKLRRLGQTESKVDLWIDLGTYYLNLPGELKADLARAMQLREQAFALAGKIEYPKGIARSMVLKGNIIRESGDKVLGTKIYEQAIAYASKMNLKDQLAEAYSAIGNLFGNEGADLEKKIAYNEKSLALYRQAGNKLEEANSLKNLGDYYNIEGQPAYAIQLMDTSLAVYKAISFKELQGVYNNMCITNISLGNFSEALKYGLLAEKTANQLADTSLQRSSINNHLGLTYYYLRNDQKALDYWLRAKNIAERYKDPGYMQTIIANVATIYVRMKRFEEGIAELKELIKKYPPTDTQMKLRIPYILFNTYYDIEQYGKAEPFFKTLIKFHHDLPKDDPNQIYLYRSIIRKLIREKQFQAADGYLKEHEKQSLAQKNLLALSQLHRLWFDVDSALNKPWSAVAHYKTYKRLTDSIWNNEKNKQISGLEIEYQTEKKDKDIALLHQKNQLQQVRIGNEERVRYFFIAGLIIAALFVGLIYNRYRLKRRSNLILEQKQEEINTQNELLRKILGEKEWLLREIHHRVKNNLQIVISLLNTQSAYLDNEDALVAIRNSQNRMHAMSLIHQKLYQSDNLAEIDMKWYIKELVEYMIECFGTDKKIQFTLETEAIKLDVAQAVPLGLILNEAISNVIKYAFPDDKKGKVHISFLLTGEERCELKIADTGIGLPAGFDPDHTESLGMSLMTGLTEQLNGEIKMWNDDGLVLDVIFKRHNELITESSALLINKN